MILVLRTRCSMHRARVTMLHTLIYTMQLPAPVPVIVAPHKVFALWPHPHFV
jgi:hypothetical protein